MVDPQVVSILNHGHPGVIHDDWMMTGGTFHMIYWTQLYPFRRDNMRNMAERDVQLQDLEGAGRGENTSVDGWTYS